MNALLFPGQGSQEIGMGLTLYKEIPTAKRLVDLANEVLGYNLRELMFEGPVEELTDTAFAQPAIYVCSAMHLERVKQNNIDYDYVAGHSLGEYTALYAANVISFEDGLRLVDKRGREMSKQNGKGTMAAVLGLTEEELAPLLPRGVVIANLNTRTQIVVSGTEDGIDILTKDMEQKDIKVVRLSVSAAFHSPHMMEASSVMKPIIENTEFKTPCCPVVSNVTGKGSTDVSVIKQNLINQITGQVRWYDSIMYLKNAGVDSFYEVGNGEVLRKLCKGITLRPKCLSV